MPTKDVGEGIQLVDVAKSDSAGLDQATKYLSLVDLANKIRQAPVDMKIKEIDAALKGNQLLMTDIANETARVELVTKRNEEVRKSADFHLNYMKSLPQLFGQDFNLGRQFLRQGFPGAEASDNKDGTVTITMQSPDGQIKPFTIDPKKVADPEKIKGMESDFRKEWQTNAKGFALQDQFYQNILKSAPLGTGAGDISIIYGYMKLQDPNSAVREGEAATAQNAPGITEQIRNLYNKALTSDGPLFGPAGSATRTQFVNASKILYDDAKSSALQQAKFFHDTAVRSNLDPRNVIIPMGAVSYKDVNDQAADQTPSRNANSPSATAPGPSPKNPPAPGTDEARRRAEDTMKKILPNMFLPGGK